MIFTNQNIKIWMWLVFLLTSMVYSNTLLAQSINQTTSSLQFSVFLIGNPEGQPVPNAIKQNLKKEMLQAGKNSAVVVLGDNVSGERIKQEFDNHTNDSYQKNLTWFDDYKGDVIFIPGEYDWFKGKKEGLKNLLNEQAIISRHLDNKTGLIPKNGCAGPTEVALNDSITLIAFDSQWFFHNFEKNSFDFGSDDKTSAFEELKNLLKKNYDKTVIVAAHHPIKSSGIHAGYFPPKTRIFPFTRINKHLYIPFPGFLYNIARQFLGFKQDLAHPEYKKYAATMNEMLKNHPNVILASAHEHSLQYHRINNIHQVISGAVVRNRYVKKLPSPSFAVSETGYARLDMFPGNEIQLSFEYLLPEEDTIKTAHKTLSRAITNPVAQQPKPTPDLSHSLEQGIISTKYQAGPWKKFWLGENYRKVWQTPVEVEKFDITSVKGGLIPVKRGGGMQTFTVRFEDKKGKQYNLRSLEKYTESVVPEPFQETFAANIVQDQISASHPFGATAVAALEEKVGLFHTNPAIVFVPDDPRLRQYRDELKNKLFLFEERPDDDWRDAAFFGHSKNIESTEDVIEELLENNKSYIDEAFLLKNRLFDMWINDWDRHQDQWRWASYKQKNSIFYKPIPRDRDQAFFLNQGIIPWIAARRWAVWKNQGFDYEIKDIAGLNFNARHFDRFLLTELSQKQWLATATELQSALNDTVIENAFKQWPEKIRQQSADEIIRKLKARRDKLPQYALDYYKILAKQVDITGSENEEYFLVTRLPDGETDVKIYDLKHNEPEELVYHRKFNLSDTREIRLFGINDNDIFKIQGTTQEAIKIRVIGGNDEDKIVDISTVEKTGKSTYIYDNFDRNTILSGSEGKDKRENTSNVHQYQRKAFKYNITSPALSTGYNVNDGVFIGGGFTSTIHGFRKTPFAQKHHLAVNLALKTEAFNVYHESIFNTVLNHWDLRIQTHIHGPNYTNNYFGYGNETRIEYFEGNFPESYNYIRNSGLSSAVSVRRRLGKVSIESGGFYETYNIEKKTNSFIADFSNNQLPENIFSQHHYYGIQGELKIDSRNKTLLPEHGFFGTTAVKWFMNGSRHDYFSQLIGDYRFYLSRRKNPRAVLAVRIGGVVNTGPYDLIHAATLGGKTNLRGYVRDRFYGDAAAYNNIDLRIKVTDFHTYIFTGKAGFFLFHDIGRVWYQDESSGKYHNGYGAGLWISPFGMSLLETHISCSEEATLVRFAFSFGF